MKYVAFLLHMYQPPWQFDDTIKQIHEQCYGWLSEWFASSGFKVTININFSLTELLEKNGLKDVIDNLIKGIGRGSIELTGSGAYHPILPLLPRGEAERQIGINEICNYESFGNLWQPRGFFPPEMAFSNEVAGVVKANYDWTITENSVYTAVHPGNSPKNYVATIDGLPVFFRSTWSNKFAQEFPNNGDTNAEHYIRWLNQDVDDETYACIAFDEETLGHHQNFNKDFMDYLQSTMSEVGIQAVHFSELLDIFPKRVELAGNGRYVGSWSTNENDIHTGNPYPLWNDPNNPVHQLQWQLIYHVIDLVNISDNLDARLLLDRGETSCTQWHAAYGRENPGLVKAGLDILMEAVVKVDPKNEKANSLYSRILNEMKN